MEGYILQWMYKALVKGERYDLVKESGTSSSSAFPAISLEFTIFGEILGYVSVF